MLEVETVPIDSLKQHPRNPRRGDVEAILKSIESNGFFDPIGVQKSTGYIIDGNHRWLAAKRAGMDSVPVVMLDVDDETAIRILLASNRTNDIAAYDESVLAELLKEAESYNDGLIGTGYTLNDVDRIVQGIAGIENDLKNETAPDQTHLLHDKYIVIVTCRDENHQNAVLEKLMSEGLECRALVS